MVIMSRQKRSREVTAAEFKATCLQLMEQVRRTRAPVRVTKRGQTLVDIVPVAESPPQSNGGLAGTVLHEKDIISPVAADEWEAMRK